jgi:hypothetical protein
MGGAEEACTVRWLEFGPYSILFLLPAVAIKSMLQTNCGSIYTTSSTLQITVYRVIVHHIVALIITMHNVIRHSAAVLSIAVPR